MRGFISNSYMNEINKLRSIIPLIKIGRLNHNKILGFFGSSQDDGKHEQSVETFLPILLCELLK